MSALRTLRRQLKIDRDRRDLPENRRIKPGTRDRRCGAADPFLLKRGLRVYLHATKGWKRRVA